MSSQHGDAPTISAARNARACQRCATAKIRCTYRTNAAPSEACERCHRLNKECLPQEPAPPKRKRTKTTRVAQLERKLDGLINMLGQQQPTGSAQTGPETPATSTPESTTQGQIRNYGYATNPDSGGPADIREGQLFSYFRSEMAPHFPFVAIPDAILHNDVQRLSPFLFSIIILLADYKSLLKQRETQRALLEPLTRRIFVQNEKSLDLLQGTLLLCAWYHVFMFDSPQMTNLLYMCVSLATDLGLNRPPQTRPWSRVQQFARRAAHGEAVNSMTRSIEERRALLGCYFLQSVISKSFRTVDPPRYTQYMDECLQVIAEANESPYDSQLVLHVRIQRINEHINRNIPEELSDPSLQEFRAPLAFAVRSMKAAIQSIRDKPGPPGDLQQIAIFLTTVAAEIQLYDTATYATLRNSTHDDTQPTTNDYLYNLLRAINLFLSTHLQVSPRVYFNLPLSYWATHGQAIVVISKVFVLDSEKWSGANLISDFNPINYFDEIIKRFAAAKKDADLPENGLFVGFEMRARMFKGWFESKLHGVRGATPPALSEWSASATQLGGAATGTARAAVGVTTTPAGQAMSPPAGAGGFRAGTSAAGTPQLGQANIDWTAYEQVWDTNGLFGNIDDSVWRQLGIDAADGAWESGLNFGSNNPMV